MKMIVTLVLLAMAGEMHWRLKIKDKKLKSIDVTFNLFRSI